MRFPRALALCLLLPACASAAKVGKVAPMCLRVGSGNIISGANGFLPGNAGLQDAPLILQSILPPPSPIPRNEYPPAITDATRRQPVTVQGQLQDSAQKSLKLDHALNMPSGRTEGEKAKGLASTVFDESSQSSLVSAKQEVRDFYKQDTGLQRLTIASLKDQAVARESRQLVQRYAAGNTNPGLGSKSLGKGIFYLRGRKGGRVFLRRTQDGLEVLAICDKKNEAAVIARLRELFLK